MATRFWLGGPKRVSAQVEGHSWAAMCILKLQKQVSRLHSVDSLSGSSVHSRLPSS